MSLIPGIAKVLGVEIGEEFRITNELGFRFKFISEDLLVQDEEEEDWYGADNEVIIALIKGEKEIIKLPFEPKYGEEYWTYAGSDGYGGWGFHYHTWDNSVFDYIYKSAGCIFRTKEEARTALPKKYKQLTGREWQND